MTLGLIFGIICLFLGFVFAMFFGSDLEEKKDNASGTLLFLAAMLMLAGGASLYEAGDKPTIKMWDSVIDEGVFYTKLGSTYCLEKEMYILTLLPKDDKSNPIVFFCENDLNGPLLIQEKGSHEISSYTESGERIP